MKFTHVLKFNTNPEWKDFYIDYQKLKKIIYQTSSAEAAEAYQVEEGGLQSGSASSAPPAVLDEELGGSGQFGLRSPLLTRSASQQAARQKDAEFVQVLDLELSRIITFYLRKESEFVSRYESLTLRMHAYEQQHGGTSLPPLPHAQLQLPGVLSVGVISAVPDTAGADVAGSVAGDSDAASVASAAVTPAGSVAPPSLLSPGPVSGASSALAAANAARIGFWSRSSGSGLVREREVLKAKMVELYEHISQLVDYLDMNREGFRKILKKHDKTISQSHYKDSYMAIVDAKLPMKNKGQLQALMASLVQLYAIVAVRGDMNKAQVELKRNLREQLKFERNTVWRDMVALERHRATVTIQEPGTGDEAAGWGWLRAYRQPLMLLLSLGVFGCLLSSHTTFPGEPEKHNCLALLVFVSLLWCTEAVPLFVTSMMVPLLAVLLRVLVDRTQDPPVRLEAQQAAPAMFHIMFSQVIMLLLGGFTIAAALSKHFIAKQLAVAILSRVGRRPRDVLLANMLVATFASMWISNVAAPVLCFSLATPILRTLPPSHPFAKALVIGIALASNLGGMTSPISSPQNIFAIERMSMDGDAPSWLAWFAVALPVSVLGNIVCWGLILLVYKPGATIKEVRPMKPSEDPLNATQIYVVVVSVGTVILWCFNSALAPICGEMGVLAIIPLVAFFGFGVLSKDDFNGFLWNVVMLAMGGLALGEAVKSSGLLLSIATELQDVVAGLGLWSILAIFCALVLVCTTFISHTVGAMIILPIVQSVGEQLEGSPHPKLLVMGAALMCSGAMGLPVSGFPNMNAVALEDPTGVNYVDTSDFLKVGVPGSILAYGIIISLGYVLMLAVGF